MNTDFYYQFRNELLDLIREVIQVQGLTKEELSDFNSTYRRLLENQFNIVLIGEFQGGKSTLFDAMCGGREISPRGAMNKTSAIAITATNIADAEEEEYALVHWKDDTELLSTMDCLLDKITFEDLGIEVGENESTLVADYVDLNNPTHLTLLKNALEIEKNTIDTLDASIRQERQDVCRIAEIILAFYNDEKLKQYKNSSNFSVEEVSRFSVFPKDWETRWGNVDAPKNFSVEEVLFAFVGRIDCYIHSEELERLGCSVTDCPGLFASAWDTSVAMDAMSKANAVIYLLSGSKSMGEGDKRAIALINEQKALNNKVFFAINRLDNPTISKNILTSDEASLKNLGIEVSVLELNVLLFFLSKFGREFVAKQLDSFSQERFIDVAKSNGYTGLTLEDVWCKIVRRIGALTDKQELETIFELSNSSIDVISKQTGYEETLPIIEQNILEKKAHSILVENGAEAIKNTLNNVEGRLRSKEEYALKKVEDCEREFHQAKIAYEEFKERVEEILTYAFPDAVSVQLARNAYYEITSTAAINNISLRLAVELPKAIDLKCKGNAAWQGIMDKLANKNGEGWAAGQKERAEKKLREVLEPVVSSAVESELSNRIKVWQNSMFNGSHPDYGIFILPRLQEAADKIKEEWNRAVSNNPILKEFGIKPAPISESVKGFQVKGVVDKGVTDVASEYAIKKIIMSVIKEVIAIVSGIIVGVVVDLVLFGGLGHALGILYGALSYILTKMGLKSEDSEEVNDVSDLKKSQRKFYDGIRPSLGNTFQKEETRNKTVSQLQACPVQIFTIFKTYYDKQLEDKEKALIDDINKKLEDKAKSLDELKEIAETAKKIRTEEIEPLSTKVDAFLQKCSI